MHGFQLTEKKTALWNSLKEGQQFKMLPASIAMGAVTGFVVAFTRLNIGLPGHKALFWMIPVITMRLAGGCKVGTTAGAAGVVFTTFSLGGHLAGEPLGLGMIIAAGFILDITINFMEKRKWPNLPSILLLGMTAMFCNLLCLVKKLFLPDGIGLHILFSNTSFWFRFGSYAFFGLLSGLIAWVIASGIRKHDRNSSRLLQ